MRALPGSVSGARGATSISPGYMSVRLLESPWKPAHWLSRIAPPPTDHLSLTYTTHLPDTSAQPLDKNCLCATSGHVGTGLAFILRSDRCKLPRFQSHGALHAFVRCCIGQGHVPGMAPRTFDASLQNASSSRRQSTALRISPTLYDLLLTRRLPGHNILHWDHPRIAGHLLTLLNLPKCSLLAATNNIIRTQPALLIGCLHPLPSPILLGGAPGSR